MDGVAIFDVRARALYHVGPSWPVADRGAILPYCRWCNRTSRVPGFVFIPWTWIEREEWPQA